MAVAVERQAQEEFFEEVRKLFHRIRVIPDESLLRSLPTSKKELEARDKATKKMVITGDIISKAEVTAIMGHETALMNVIVEILQKYEKTFQMGRISPSTKKLRLSDEIKRKLTQIAAAIKRDKNYGSIPERTARIKKINALRKGMTPSAILGFGNSVREGVGTALELRANYDEIVSNTCRLRASREIMELLRKQKRTFTPKTAYHIYVKAVNMDPRMQAHAKLLNGMREQRNKVLKLQIRKKPIPKNLELPSRSKMRHK